MAFDWQTFLQNQSINPVTPLVRDPFSGLPITPLTRTDPVYPGQSTSPVTPLPFTPTPVAGSAPPLTGRAIHPGFGQPAYPAGGRNLYDTPFVRDYVSPLLPEGEYQRRLNQIGMGDMSSRFGQFGQSQYGNTQRRYQSAQLSNPALSFRDFLRKGGAGGLSNMWRGMSGQQRGLNAPSRSSIVRLG